MGHRGVCPYRGIGYYRVDCINIKSLGSLIYKMETCDVTCMLRLAAVTVVLDKIKKRRTETAVADDLTCSQVNRLGGLTNYN